MRGFIARRRWRLSSSWRCGAGVGAEGRRHAAGHPSRQPAQRLDPRGGDDLDRHALHVGLQQPGGVRSPVQAERARPHRARPRDRMGVERRRHQAHLQAARRREVARRQALHQRRREMHLGHADRARIEAAQEPAQVVVVQPQGGDGERRPRGHLPSRPAAALGADHAGRRLLAGLSLPRAGRPDAHQADRHRALQVRRAEAERIDEGGAQSRLLEARPALSRRHRVHHHRQSRDLDAGLHRRQSPTSPSPPRSPRRC